MRFFEISFGVVVCVLAAKALEMEECGLPRRRQCRHAVLDELDKQKRALSTHEQEFHCRTLRDNMECLVWQLSECQTSEAQEGNSDVIWRAWKYMKIVCIAFEDWRQKSCFIGDGAKKCEKHLLIGEARNKKSTCEDFENFRDCIIEVVESKCTDDESSFFGSYLMDQAGSMIWMCPKPEDNTVVAEGSHIHAYRSSPLTGDSPFVTGCNARATEEMKGCLDRHQFEKDQSLGAKEPEERLRRTCCATWNYRRCVQNAVRIHCYDSREIDVQSANDIIPHDRDFLCREHWIYTCTNAGNTLSTISAASQVLLLTLVTYAVLDKSC